MKYELSKELVYKVSSQEEYKQFLGFIQSKGFPIFNNLVYITSWDHVQWKGNDFRLTQTCDTKYPIVNCKDVIGFKDDVFTLPKKWCVKVTEESQKTLYNWVKYKSDFDKAYFPVRNWVINHKDDGSYQKWTKGETPLDYTEITFDQFKQYVLKDNVQIVKNEFKKGDYIVQLHDSTTNFKKHFCYKQKKSGYLLPELDTSGNPDNGWCAIDFKNSDRWRYANEAEIAEYNRLGKPFDVTILNTKPKSLVGRYLKALVDYPWDIGNCKKGDYLVIINSTQCYRVKDTNKIKWIYSNTFTDYLPHQDFELMPEGFIPDSEVKSEIPEYVTCISKVYGLTVGKVYPVIGKFVIDGKYNNYSWDDKEYFIPSTKEAYDLQNSSVKISSNEPVINTYGLYVSDFLPNAVINEWSRMGNNYVEYSGKWKTGRGFYVGDRKIEGFKVIDGIVGFKVSDSSTYLKAEGFKQFMENFGKKSEDWIPQVGKYAVMVNAGGWGYNHENNGCIALITEVLTIKIGLYNERFDVYSISGEIINPNKEDWVKFTNIPVIDKNKNIICRKALPHEIPTETSKPDIMTEDKFDSLFKESEEKFKVGDWVWNSEHGEILQIEDVNDSHFKGKYPCKHLGYYYTLNSKKGKEDFYNRKATPKEIAKATGKSVIPESYLQYPVKSSEAYKEPIAPVDVLNKYQQTPVIYSGKKVKSKIVTIFN